MNVAAARQPRQEFYAVYDEEKGWVGSLGLLHTVVNVSACVAVWYAASVFRASWPAIAYLCIMPTWALSGGYGTRRKKQASFFIASLAALAPGFVARYVGFNPALLHWSGLVLLVMASFVLVTVDHIETKGIPSIMSVVDPLWLVVASIALAVGVLAEPLLHHRIYGDIDLRQVVLGVALSYPSYCILRSWRIVFSSGWSQTGKRLGTSSLQDEGPFTTVVVRTWLFLVFAARPFLRFFLADAAQLMRILFRWSRTYLLILLSFALAKILYDIIGTLLIGHIATPSILSVAMIGLLAFPALFIHMLAAAIMNEVRWGAPTEVWWSDQDALFEHVKSLLMWTYGLLLTGLVCIVIIPGIVIMAMTRTFSVFWLVGTLSFLGVAALGMLFSLGLRLGRTRTR